MKANTLLSLTSLLCIVLLTFHLADDVVLGKDVLDVARLSIYLPIIAIWLCGTLLLTGRRAGYGICMLGALLGLSVVAIHASGANGIHGAFLHVWLLVAIGGASFFALILAVIGLIELRSSTLHLQANRKRGHTPASSSAQAVDNS